MTRTARSLWPHVDLESACVSVDRRPPRLAPQGIEVPGPLVNLPRDLHNWLTGSERGSESSQACLPRCATSIWSTPRAFGWIVELASISLLRIMVKRPAI
ncbi:unnamed protein product [Lampetra fluviatilis]